MSNNIDERIVQMEFNNGQFERGIKESSKSIEEFQEKLQFKEATRGIRELERASSSFSLEGMAQSVYAIENTFTSAFGRIKAQFIDRLADEVYDFGKKYIKMFTVDQLASGWQKYSDKTAAVQTIVNATGKDIDYVNEQLQKLNWFTDETSYNFVDMVGNIGKFTSMNVPLDEAVTAMQGIATWASVSGQGAGEASRAMYNLAQAIGVGSVKLMDWRSIENANMSTTEFKTTVIETAKALGVLSKAGKTAKGTQVTLENFTQTLAEGWFTKDVLLNVLQQYGEFADKVYEASEHGLIPAAEAMKMVSVEEGNLGKKAFKAAQEAKTLKEAIDATSDAVSSGWMDTWEIIFGNYEQAKVIWTDLANALWEVFASGAEARNELLRAWADSKIGGRADMLKAVYSILNSIWSIIVSIREAFSDMLPEITVETLQNLTKDLDEFSKKLDKLFYRRERYTDSQLKAVRNYETDLVEAFDGAMSKGANSPGVKKLQERLIELGYDVGPTMADGIWGPKTEAAFRKFQEEAGLTVDGVYKEKDHQALMKALNLLSNPIDGGILESVVEYSDKMQELRNIFAGVGAVVNIVRRAFMLLWNTVSSIGGAVLGPMAEMFLTIGSNIGLALVNLDAWIEDSGIFENWFKSVEEWLAPFSESMEKVKTSVLDFFGFGDKASESNEELVTFQSIWSNVMTSLKESGVIDKVTGSWERLKGTLTSLKETIRGYWKSVSTYLADKFSGAIESAGSWLPRIMETLGNGLSSALDFINSILASIPSGVDSIINFFTKIYNSLAESKTVKAAGEHLSSAFASIRNAFETTLPKLKEYWEQAKSWLSEKFGGLFGSAESVLPSIIASLGQSLAVAFDWVSNAISNLPKHIASIKKFFIDLYNKLKSSEKLQSIVEKVKKIFNGIKEVFGEIWNSIVAFFFPEESSGAKKSKRQARRKRKGKGEIEETTEAAEEKVSFLEKAWAWIKSAVKVIKDSIVTVVKWIFEGVSQIWNALGFWRIVIGSVAGIGLLVFAVVKLIKLITNLTDSIGALKNGPKKQAQRAENFATQFLKAAAAVALIAAAIYVLGSMDGEAFKRGAWAVGIITGVLVAIGVLFWILGKVKNGVDASNSAAKVLMALKDLAIAVGILAASIVVLGLMGWTIVGRGMAMTALILSGVLGFSALLGKVTKNNLNISGAISSLKQLGVAIAILAGISILMGMFGSLKGIGMLAVVMALLGAFTVVLTKFGAKSLKINIAIKGLLKMAIAIGILAGIVYLLGTMNGWQLLQGVVGLGAIAIILGLLTKTVASAGSGLNTAALVVMFLGIAAVAIVITECIKAIKDVDYKVILSFVGGIAGVLLAIGGLSLLVGKLHAGGAVVGGAAAISGAFAIVAVVLTAVLGGLGAIDEAIANANTNGKGLKEYVQDGGAILQAIADALDPFIGDWNRAAGVIGLAIASIVVGAIPGGGLVLMGGATSISASFTIIVTFLTALLAGLGAIDQCAKDAGVSGGEGLAGLIESGGDIFAAISGAVAKFVTGFVDTLVNSLVTNITKFGTAVNSLKESSAGLGTNEEIQADIDAAIGIFTYMGTYFKTLKPYNFTRSNFESYATAPRQLATDITEFSISMAELRKATDGLAGDIEFDSNLATAVKAAGRIKEFFGRLKPYEVHGSLFTGYFTAPGQLSTDIGLFGDALVSFRTGVEGLTDDMTTIPGTEPAISAAKSIQGFFVDIDEAFGTVKEKGTSLTEFNAEILSMLTDISLFGTRMGEVANKLNVESITDGSITTQTDNAIEAAKSVAGFLIKLSFYGGSIEKNQSWLGRLFGKESTQQTVFSSVADLGSKTASAANKLKGLKTSDVEKIQSGVAIASSMVDLVNSLSSNGSIIQGNTGVLADTIRLIGSLGVNLGTLHENVKNMVVDPGTMANTEALSQLDIIDKMIAKVQTMSGISDAETAVNNLSTIISDIGLLGANVLEADMYFTDDNISHFTSIADGIGKIADAIFNVQVTTTSGVKSALATEIENISAALSSASWDGIDTNAIAASISATIDMTIIQTIGTEFADAIGNGISLSELPYTAFGTILQSLSSIGTDYKANFESIGRQFNAGIERGIRSTSNRIYQAVREVVSQMVSVARNQADIHSPSGEGEDIGMYFNLGIVRGLLGYSDQVTAASRQVMENLIGSAVETAAAITAIINDDMDTQPVIRPVLDLSNVSIGAQSMNSMFGNRTIGVASTDMATRIRTNANYIPVGSRNNVNLSDSIQSVNDRLDNLGEAVTNMKIVLDSGVVAGQIAPKIDKHLGRAISLKGRG